MSTGEERSLYRGAALSGDVTRPGTTQGWEPGALLEASAAGREDSRRYSALLTFAAADHAFALAAEQVHDWLASHGWNTDISTSSLHHDTHRDLTVIRRTAPEGQSLRVRVVERSDDGVWSTDITIHVPPSGPGWFALEVNNDRGRLAAVPDLATRLLDTLEVNDGLGSMSSRPVVLGEGHIDELIDVLCDPQRRALIVAAATDEHGQLGEFAARVGRWTKQVHGLAEVVVLDPRASRLFEDQVGSSHAVSPWTMRLFQPEIDPAWKMDGRRHRILGNKGLPESSDGALAELLGGAARVHASRRVTPVAVTAVLSELTRLEDDLVLAALAPDAVVGARPAAPTDLSAPDQVAVVKRIFELDHVDEASLLRIADELARAKVGVVALQRVKGQFRAHRTRLEALEQMNKQLQNSLLEEQYERALVEAEKDELADKNRFYSTQLATTLGPESRDTAVPEEAMTSYPASFTDLVTRLPELKSRGVVFTGESSDVRSLDQVDNFGQLARFTWEALLTLADYIRARDEGHWQLGFDDYLRRATQPYRTFPRRRHAARESATTMHNWGSQRTFRVPKTVDPSGLTSMQAHIKLGKIGMVSPRLYYLDCWSLSRKVYIGYIGAHLTNTRSH